MDSWHGQPDIEEKNRNSGDTILNCRFAGHGTVISCREVSVRQGANQERRAAYCLAMAPVTGKSAKMAGQDTFTVIARVRHFSWGNTYRLRLDTAVQVVAWLDAGGKELIVNSVGGSEAAALTIAEAMVKTGNIKVRVTGICSSACSQYILPAAKDVLIEEGSLVGFHISSFAISKLIFNRTSLFSVSEYELIKNIADRTENLYLKVGKSPEILLEAAYFSDPICVRKQKSGESEIVLGQDIWVPDAYTLKRYHLVSSSINLPRNGPEALGRAARYLKSGTRLGYGSAELLPKQQKTARILKTCGI